MAAASAGGSALIAALLAAGNVICSSVSWVVTSLLSVAGPLEWRKH
jgi:hypothetical protein